MANLKTSSEASGVPIQSSDLFRIARAGANYKLTTEEIFTETVTKSELVSKISSNSLIPGRVYKVLSPTTSNLTSLMFVEAVANNQINSEVVIIVNNLPYPVYYDLANDIFNYINTTYNVFRADLIAGKLIPGMTYRISDYASRNFLNGYSNAYAGWNNNSTSYTKYGPGSGNANYNSSQIHTGSIEPLYVTATASDKVSNIVKSELHPDDIIYYSPYTNKVGVRGPIDANLCTVGFNGTCMYIDLPPGVSIDYGQYLEIYLVFDSYNYYSSNIINYITPGVNYKQTLKNGYYNSEDDIETDIELTNNGNRILLKDLDSTNYAEYEDLGLYTSSVVSYSDATGYIYYRKDPVKNIEFSYDYRNALFRRFEIDLANIDPMFTGDPNQFIYAGVSDNYLGSAGTTGNYKDYPVLFGLDNANISEIGDPYASPYSQGNNIYKSSCVNLIAGVYFIDNTFLNTVQNCKFSIYNADNIFNDTVYSCEFISCGSSIFLGEVTRSTFKTFWYFVLTKGTIRDSDFVEDNISFIKINNFYNTKVYSPISVYNFLSATHVQSGYSCQIILDSTATPRLFYYNGTNLVFVAPNA